VHARLIHKLFGDFMLIEPVILGVKRNTLICQVSESMR